MINVGVIGCGYWGPNLIRNFATCAETELSDWRTVERIVRVELRLSVAKVQSEVTT